MVGIIMILATGPASCIHPVHLYKAGYIIMIANYGDL